MKLSHHVRELLRTAEFLHDVPQSVTLYRVKGIHQIHEGSIEVIPHLLALLFYLAGFKDHIGCSAVSAETTLAFREQALL
ncbi:unnamed protein product [Schistocephalus solidus]|uniref:HD_domain domain-containing protein n=1 Tax=Schistocephalus solidus TaxID=70667 RepID=A0A183TET5_SCHSO|nr:unnamed protein product [Schistocephalus solidus]